MANAICHLDDLWCCPICYPDDTTKFETYVIWMTDLLAVSHPDDWWRMQYIIGMTYDVILSSGSCNASCMSCGWLSSCLDLIRMTHGRCSISSKWFTAMRLIKRNLNTKPSGWLSLKLYATEWFRVNACSMSSGGQNEIFCPLHSLLVKRCQGQGIFGCFMYPD